MNLTVQIPGAVQRSEQLPSAELARERADPVVYDNDGNQRFGVYSIWRTLSGERGRQRILCGQPVGLAGIHGWLCGDIPPVPLRSRALDKSRPGGLERGGPDESAVLESVWVFDE